jgi:hypothetical protein
MNKYSKQELQDMARYVLQSQNQFNISLFYELLKMKTGFSIDRIKLQMHLYSKGLF